MFFIFAEDFIILFNKNRDFHLGVLINTREHLYFEERD